MSKASSRTLHVIRCVHTVVWAFFVIAIVGIPVAAWLGRRDVFLVLTGIVMVEVAVLAVNRMRCPLTGVAARYTDDRRANFDIYLPLWLARYNKHVFGPLYVACVTWGLWRLWG